MLNTDDIRFLRTIRENASLLAAAHRLGVTPSAVSQRLQHIERRLGIQLVDRSARQLRFTDEGELLCRAGAGITRELDTLIESLTARRDGAIGTLAINAPFGFGRRYIGPLVAMFRQQYPEVEVRLMLSERPLVSQTDHFDILIHIGRLPASTLVSHRIAPNRRFVCAAPRLVKRHGLPSHPNDLAGWPVIALNENEEDASHWQFKQRRQIVNVRSRPVLVGNDGEVTRQWAIEGLGVLIRSEWDVAEALAHGELTQLLPDWTLPDADVVALTPQRDGLAHRTRTFLKLLKSHFSPVAPWRTRSK